MESETKESRVVPDTMRAAIQHRYGVGNIEVRQVPTPEPTGDQVLVEVVASSVNAFEWHMTSGKPYFMRLTQGFLRPKKSEIGADIAGTVVAVGPNASRFEVGDDVFGDIGFGAYAEYAAASEKKLALKPKEVSFEEAAAAPLAGLTALQGLRDHAHIREGQKVLVNGASGGVGTYALQIARALGAEVTAVVSPRNVELARELGADRVVDYTAEDFTGLNEQFDLVFDGPGNRPLRKIRRVMKPDAAYLLFGGPKGRVVGPLLRLIRTALAFRFWSQRFTGMFLARVDHHDLEALGEMLASGRIKSAVTDRVGLDEVAQAVDRQGEFHARGKTVVIV